MKRPPSYSDSYYVLGGSHTPPSLNSLESVEEPTPRPPVATPPGPRIQLFFIKSAIHLFLISVFETIFFFQYVSVTENTGILKTIDTYYTPLIDTCPTWSPIVKEGIYQILMGNQTYMDIVLAGESGLAQRQKANQSLLGESLIASGLCLAIVIGGAGLLWWKRIPVRWWVVFGENLSMVVLLGIYEYIFFQFIIYNYGTLSTPELNEYLVKGIWNCVEGVGDWAKN